MGTLMIGLLSAGFSVPAASAADTMPTIEVANAADGSHLLVNGRDFMVFGMNWGHMPIGQNYSYSLFNQSDDVIRAALDREMPLLQAMGVNTIRHYAGMPPRWVTYVYEKYGIYTVLNHTVGRYGLTLDGVWHPVTDYSDPQVRAQLKSEVVALVDEFKDTPGVLMWLLGNENNYGLSWSSFEIEALPEGERNQFRARFLYSLMGEIIDAVHQHDPGRPVAIANGDVQYIDLVAEECPGLDVFGTNVYRGISARDLYQVVHDKLGIPIVYTEFGCDAFNAVTMQEDQAMQARYLLGQWEEIYEQSAGKGRVGNAIGGMIFQWSDGWWKYKQEERLDIHDTHASWPNGGYPEDLREGENNMNEEWWGICAKGLPDPRGIYDVYPRAAYYCLRDAFRLNPYGPDTDLDRIRSWFANIQPMAGVLTARGDAAALRTDALSKVRLSGLRMEFETYSTNGDNVSTPSIQSPQDDGYPAFLGFDHGQSFYADFEAKPSETVQGRLSVNVLGRVPNNPIDEIFYENRGRSKIIYDGSGNKVLLPSTERVKVYQGSLSWDDRRFTLDAFYRVGHLHWQYEGDFFGLYRDAFYGENIDIYNGEAPIGFEVTGKKSLTGLKMAFGPQLWWGANPAVFLKHQRNFLGAGWTAMFQEDFEQQTEVTSSVAIPVRTTRKASLQMETRRWGLGIQGGLLWAGQPRIGETFQLMDDDLVKRGGPYAPGDVLQDKIKTEDTFGFKGKLTWEKNRWHWYGQGAYMGLVADAGPTSIPTFTGWQLQDSGSGNQVNALTGVAYNIGDWQIGPNFLWQKPLVAPMPHSDDLVGTAGHTRNVIDDAFAVIGNRETRAAEIMFTYDPTPATWMWAWDNDRREDAKFATSFGLTLRDHPTTADARLFVSETGAVYPFPGGTPARDFGELWDLHARIVNRVSGSARMVSNIVFGSAEPRGDNDRLVKRFSVDSRVIWPAVAFAWHVKLNDFGPYDYHQDFNMTFPLQLMGDLSYSLGRPAWFDLPQTRIGIRGTYRTLDRYSNRYHPEGAIEPVGNELYPSGLPKGNEWEIRTYLHLAM
ncbi:glycosidase [bacterium CG_4_9_14_3_um_filter_65_15]|nr:MAG: glycosidase [bacterium CG_4_9_14_3_um_filter_65_15]